MNEAVGGGNSTARGERTHTARAGVSHCVPAVAAGIPDGLLRDTEIPWSPMPDTVESLILDLLEWIGPGSRPYAEVLDAWRTSCPRLPVWEDANDRGFVACHHEVGQGRRISVTVTGREHLQKQRPMSMAVVPSPSSPSSGNFSVERPLPL